MNETTVKPGEKLEAGGAVLAIEPNYKDGQLQRVDILTEGGRFAVALGQYSNLALLTPATTIRYAVVGTLAEVEVDEVFDTVTDANIRKEGLDAKGATVVVEERVVRG